MEEKNVPLFSLSVSFSLKSVTQNEKVRCVIRMSEDIDVWKEEEGEKRRERGDVSCAPLIPAGY